MFPRRWFIAVAIAVILLGAAAILLGGAVFVALMCVPAATVVYWHDAQGWFSQYPAIRAGAAASVVAAGTALFSLRRYAPKLYAILELAAAIGLGWIALGAAKADRLTIGLALVTTCYVVVRAVALLSDNLKSSDIPVKVMVSRTRIIVHQGKEILANIPKHLDEFAYESDLKAALARIEVLETVSPLRVAAIPNRQEARQQENSE
jgi:hypothetical protein